MKLKCLFILLAFTLGCSAQDPSPDGSNLTISPMVDLEKNKEMILALKQFLKTKNNDNTQNKHWLRSDFTRYVYPFLDIFNIENSKYGDNFYKPTLMEIVATGRPDQKIIKLAFLGHNKKTNENQIKSIFNIIANADNNEIIFSSYLDHAIESWQMYKSESLTYYISPGKLINHTEIEKQQKDIARLCTFFNISPIPITYYSCVNPKEIFEIKGFDYNPIMYADKSGGLADFGNRIFSGNNSEYYTHEIVHIYTNNLFQKINKFIDEGIATYIAGSGHFDYPWHREKLKKFLLENPTFDLAEHTDIYEKLYADDETPIPYMTSALICEYTFSKFGKEKLLTILNNDSELWFVLNTIGLTKQNLNNELRTLISDDLTSLF
jgi:hypothetical protein